mgnify:CR=1 FL=1
MDIATLPRRTQAQRREESDGRLLAAAAAIIAEEGYLAATLERVGERAGFSRCVPYYEIPAEFAPLTVFMERALA